MAFRVVDEPILGFKASQRVTCVSDADVSAGRRALNIVPECQEIMLYASAAVRVGFTPKILGMWFYDDSLIGDARWRDLLDPTKAILDSSKSTPVSEFTIGGTADFIYIALNDQPAGFEFDLTALNNNVTTANFAYLGPGNQFVTTAITTSWTSAFDADGRFTIDTKPTDWGPRIPDVEQRPPNQNERAYWCRIGAGAALDSVTIVQARTFGSPDLTGTSGDGVMDVFKADMGFIEATTSYTIDVSREVGSIEYISQAATTPTIAITFIKR